MFDMSIRSGDIGDQSQKLSEIAPKFGRLFGPAIHFFLGGGPSKNCTHIITPALNRSIDQSINQYNNL